MTTLENEDEEAIFVVSGEDGVERELVPVYSFDHADKEYVVLIDRNDPESDGLILRMEQDGEEMVLSNIEDDEEWEAVENIYNEILKQETSDE